MPINQFKFSVAGILVLFSFAIGCTKIDTTNLGNNLIPAVDNIHTFDTTFSIIASNNYDNVCDTNHRYNLQALGIISNDPLFGKTNGKIYVEFKPGSFPFTFPVADANSFQVDSAIIVLQYSHSFGDTNALQKVNVYPLTDSFDLTKNYNSCLQLDYDANTLLGEKRYYPTLIKDSVHAYQENAANQLRIPLSASFIQNLIKDSAAIFKSDSAFVNYFRGFALIPDEATGGQALNYFDLTTSRLSFYLRYTNSGKADTAAIDFPFSGICGLSNSIAHDRTDAEMLAYQSNGSGGDSLLYVQTSPGTHVMLNIPGLTNLSNRVINRAEIIVDQVYSPAALDNVFNVPSDLYVDVKDSSISDTDYIPLPCDFSGYELSNNFQNLGGQVKYVTNSSGQSVAEYTLNISRYVQSVVTKGKKNLTLRLRAPDFIRNKSTYIDYCNQGIAPFSIMRNNVADGRVKLNGTNNTPTRIRLHVIYSVL